MTAAQSVMPLPDQPSPHFTWSPEFECHDVTGTQYPLDWRVLRGVPLAIELERIRSRIGPFTPTSVFRTWDWHVAIYARMNPKQTPPPTSGHLFGRAADVPWAPSEHMPTWESFRAGILAAAREPGSKLTYIRFYRHDSFAHVEMRPSLTALKVEYEAT